MTQAQPPTAAPAPARLPGWGHHVSFFQRREAAFWLFAVLLGITGLMVLTEQLTYLEVFPAGWMVSIALLALYVVPVAIAIYVLDLFEREPISLVIAAFLWGGVVAIGLSAETNGAWLQIVAKTAGLDVAREWGAALVAPPVEETFKFLGVVTIYLIARSEIDDLFDGFIYGALIGLGFAAVENVQYFVQAIDTSGGRDQVGPVLQMFLLRVIFVGAYMHVLWSGVAGLGLAYYVTQRDRSRGQRLAIGGGLFVLAVVAHVVWNSPLLVNLVGAGPIGQILYGLIKGSPFLIFVVLLVLLAQRREHRWFRLATASDIGTDVLTAEEVAQLGGLRSRWRSRRLVGDRKGPAGRRLMSQLQREQINLAMIRARSGADDHPAVEAQRQRIRSIRADLQGLPDIDQTYAMAPTPAGLPLATPSAASASASPPTAEPAAMPAPAPPAEPRAVPSSAAPPPPPPPAATWQPTHVVPASGLPAWAAPDATSVPVAYLPPGLELRAVEQLGAWGRVEAAGGWSGWLDGRYLVPR